MILSMEIKHTPFNIEIISFSVHLECLFPKPGGPNCCEKDRKFRSCNSLLAKTVHR